MTTTFNDNLQVTMTIGDEEWLVSEARVENSRISTPDYVQITKMVPSESDPSVVASNISEYRGKEFELYADNEIISVRGTDAEEDSLLFKGRLANISPTGTKSFEGIAYNAAHQPFIDPEESSTSTNGGDETFDSETDGRNQETAGSILNHTVNLSIPSQSLESQTSEDEGTEQPEARIDAKVALKKGIERLGLDPENEDKVKIRLREEGYTFDKENYPTMGINQKINLYTTQPKLIDLFDKIRDETRSEWWFDKDGTFNFGALPPRSRHYLKFITDTTAGLNTPPYRSVKVIGSGIVSVEGESQLRNEDRIVKGREIVVEDGVATIKKPQNGISNMVDPTFVYKNLEISSDLQADNTAESIMSDLKEQIKSGKITVTGFPEVTPLDVVKMPQAADESKPNYSPRQPLGGAEYTVTKVVHKLNNSDGFKTVIHVGGLTPVTNDDYEAVEEPKDNAKQDANTKNQDGNFWDELVEDAGNLIESLSPY